MQGKLERYPCQSRQGPAVALPERVGSEIPPNVAKCRKMSHPKKDVIAKTRSP
jgi:hypothetical protein